MRAILIATHAYRFFSRNVPNNYQPARPVLGDMEMTYDSTRRDFLRKAGALGVGLATSGLAAPYVAKATGADCQ